MIPLMMQKDYQPKGWRESWLGALRICYQFVVIPLTCDTTTRCSGPAVGHSHVVCDVGR